MYNIELQKIPNQEFTYIVGDKSFLVRLRTIQDLTFADISVDGQPVLYSQICSPNTFINTYRYISAGGKFYFKCVDNEYPNYKNFGDTQQLQFYTEDEL